MEQLDQQQTELEENVGNWAREVKPLMQQGKHSSDVCLPLLNVPASSARHYYRPPSPLRTSPITLFSIYNVMVVSQSPSL